MFSGSQDLWLSRGTHHYPQRAKSIILSSCTPAAVHPAVKPYCTPPPVLQRNTTVSCRSGNRYNLHPNIAKTSFHSIITQYYSHIITYTISYATSVNISVSQCYPCPCSFAANARSDVSLADITLLFIPCFI